MKLALTIIATLFGGGIFYWTISRIAPRGTVLVIAVVLYVMGQVIGALDVGIRVIELVSGVLKLSGFLGIILGGIDILRKRETAETLNVEAAGSLDPKK